MPTSGSYKPYVGRPSASVPKSLRKVKSGDPLIIPAQTFNAFVDAALDHRFHQRQVAAGDLFATKRTDVVLVRNDSGADRDRFDVLAVTGPLIGPIDNEDEFASRVALSGVVPEQQHRGRFAVLLEPVRDGEIGRAVLDGLCVVHVEMVNESHRFADVKPNYCDVLESAAFGSAQLLWIQPEGERDDPAIAWTVARIGLPPGGSVQLARLAGYVFDGSMAVAYQGFFIDAIAQNNPDPMPDLVEIWPRRFPKATSQYRDMRQVVPKPKFQTDLAPGAGCDTDGQSDVFVVWASDARVPAEQGGGRWWVVWAFTGLCIG